MTTQIGTNYEDNVAEALKKKAKTLGVSMKEVITGALVDQGEYQYNQAVKTIEMYEELIKTGKSGVLTLKNPSKAELKQIKGVITMMKKQKAANESFHQIYEEENHEEVEYVEA